MLLYPAIDILSGRCVRLQKGELEEVTDYGTPVDVAQRYRDAGAQYLHVVDLDGAFGSGENSSAIGAIVTGTELPVQVGGGIRSRAHVQRYLDSGVSRVILGTAALEQPDLLTWALGKYGDRIAVGLDARQGLVALRGWQQQSDTDVIAAARALASCGVRHIIYTDIGRDGMLSGPDADTTARLVEEIDAGIIGSGGISALEDIDAVRNTGAVGLIIGRALLDGAFTLAEASAHAAVC